MALELAWPQKRGELCFQIEEKRVEKFFLHKNLSLQRLPKPIFSSKNLKIFQVPAAQSELRIATPKNIFKLAVTRNKIKRQIKNIFHINNLHEDGSLFVIKVFKPFSLLSYQEASFEICKAVKS